MFKNCLAVECNYEFSQLVSKLSWPKLYKKKTTKLKNKILKTTEKLITKNKIIKYVWWQ